ncbi:hypothetical protein IVB40_24560 [Bradyrhizobium sp. 40]|uniref:hypothetical protein n=1 Tax=Bradyrhizobium sp. 40 TaxID=2782674 RepID=UPI001FFE71B7|nr:hypothetical protein [Bradyrhizobium sp. 40]UPJ40459.1 hypothetical protein IVB40_24560 [Bradyrhizobium sp. 40]
MSIMSVWSGAASQVPNRHVGPASRGIFAFIMSALHASRRHQAGRVLRHYEHLLTNELKHNAGERE